MSDPTMNVSLGEAAATPSCNAITAPPRPSPISPSGCVSYPSWIPLSRGLVSVRRRPSAPAVRRSAISALLSQFWTGPPRQQHSPAALRALSYARLGSRDADPRFFVRPSRGDARATTSRLAVDAVVERVQTRYDAASTSALASRSLTSTAIGRKTNSAGGVMFKTPGGCAGTTTSPRRRPTSATAACCGSTNRKTSRPSNRS